VRDIEALRRDLRRWVAANLISAEQAAAIEASESADVPAGDATRKDNSRVPIVVEALGYVGGALAVVAGFIATRQLWQDMSRGTLEGFAAAGCVVLLGGGAALRSADDPAFGRLRSVLFLLSAACLTAFAALLGDDHSRNDERLVMVVALIAAAYLLALHLWHGSLLLVIALFVALAVAAGAFSLAITEDEEAWQVGLAVWLLGVVWAAGAGRIAALEPVDGALLGGVGGAFVGAQLMMTRDLGHLVAVVTVAAVIVAGTWLRRTWMLALGTLGVLVVVPQTATRFLPDSVGAPVAVFVVGAGLVAIAVWLARRPGRRRPAG
jgi:hypothetical protein